MKFENYIPESIIKRKKKYQKIKNILSVILYIILIPIILCNLFLIAQSIFFPNKTASIIGMKSYIIVSGSMKPKMNVGDIVIVKKMKKTSDYNVGDIISYHENNSIVTHRIIQIQKSQKGKSSYVTKGDNNNAEDNFRVEQNNIEGKVIKIIPKLGLLSLFVENHIFLLIIFILLYAFISSNVRKMVRRKRREKKRKEYNMKL